MGLVRYLNLKNGFLIIKYFSKLIAEIDAIEAKLPIPETIP